MIKKNTKIVFENNDGEKEKELIGGIPLSVGEIMHIKKNESGKNEDYEVVNKQINCLMQEEDQIVDIVYTLKKVIK